MLIVDQYFGADELFRFGLANGNPSIPIRVLTSAARLKKASDALTEIRGATLLREWQRVSDALNTNPIEIRAMPGDPPPVHDRFMVVDDAVWLLGSSLNAFGSAGTLLVMLPDPAPVRAALEDAWNAAHALNSLFGYPPAPAKP